MRHRRSVRGSRLLSAIKYAKVTTIRDEDGLAIDFKVEGEYPQFGNNDARVDDIACDLVERFMKKIQKLRTYRNAVPTQSVLTITSNVVYGKKTGNTRMAAAQAHRSAQVPTRCTAATRKAQ